MPKIEFKEGDKLTYLGRGFIGFVPDERDMEYLSKDERYPRDHWVMYKGIKLLVMDHEIKKAPKG
jgi:hypothetical protein